MTLDSFPKLVYRGNNHFNRQILAGATRYGAQEIEVQSIGLLHCGSDL